MGQRDVDRDPSHRQLRGRAPLAAVAGRTRHEPSSSAPAARSTRDGGRTQLHGHVAMVATTPDILRHPLPDEGRAITRGRRLITELVHFRPDVAGNAPKR
jgi:hypothetical protein